MNKFNELLKFCREKIGYSKGQLNKLVNRNYLSMENGSRPISKKVYDELDKHFNFEQFDISEDIKDEIICKLDKLNIYQLYLISHKIDKEILQKCEVIDE